MPGDGTVAVPERLQCGDLLALERQQPGEHDRADEGDQAAGNEGEPGPSYALEDRRQRHAVAQSSLDHVDVQSHWWRE